MEDKIELTRSIVKAVLAQWEDRERGFTAGERVQYRADRDNKPVEEISGKAADDFIKRARKLIPKPIDT